MWRVDGKTAITRLAVDGPTPHKSLSDGLLSIVRRTGKDTHRSYATAQAKRMKMDLGCFPQSHRLEDLVNAFLLGMETLNVQIEQVYISHRGTCMHGKGALSARIHKDLLISDLLA